MGSRPAGRWRVVCGQALRSRWCQWRCCENEGTAAEMERGGKGGVGAGGWLRYKKVRRKSLEGAGRKEERVIRRSATCDVHRRVGGGVVT